MPNTSQVLQHLLADGKTRHVIEQLLRLTATDRDQQNEVLQLSAQFAELERQSRLNVTDPKLLGTERNRINAALLAVIDRLPENLSPLRRKWNVGKIALWLGIFAAVAGITGYTLRDFFKKPEPTPVQLPAGPVEKLIAKPGENSTPAKSGKNNPNITVKDKAKVGIISTGDSVTINAKQDF